MADIIKKIGRSLVQHGPYNRRVYLMKLDAQDMSHILPALDRLARENHYEKILTKVPSASKAVFEKRLYLQRGPLSEFFRSGCRVPDDQEQTGYEAYPGHAVS